MQIEYQINVDDIVAFNVHHHRNSPDWKRRIRLFRFFGIFVALFGALAWARLGMGLRIFVILGYSLILLFGYPALSIWSTKRYTRKTYSKGQNRGVLGNHILALDSDGVIEISDVGETRTSWSGVEKIESNDDYIYLYISSLMAHIIPKRAFLNPVEAANFVQIAHESITVSCRKGRMPVEPCSLDA